MKRKVTYLLFTLLLMFAGISGCGSEQKASADAEAAGSALTKAEWIGMLGDKFGYNVYENTADYYTDVDSSNSYYDQIQACAEWEVITEKSEFTPDAGADWQYAVETAVRAIGIDKLNNSDAGMEVTEDNLADFFTTKIVNVDAGALKADLSKGDAELILEYAYNYGANLTLNEKIEYTYQDGVKEAAAGAIELTGDGTTAVIKDGGSYEAGDVIYVQPSDNSAAYAVKVTAVNGDVITYETAAVEEVFEELSVSGTFEGNVISVSPAEGVEVEMNNGSEGDLAPMSYTAMDYRIMNGSSDARVMNVGASASVNGNGASFTYSDGGVSFGVSVYDITASPNVELSYAKMLGIQTGFVNGIKKAEVTVTMKDKVTLQYQAEGYSKTVNLGKVSMVLGTTPFTLEVSLAAHIGLDGEITLTYNSQIVATAKYSGGKGIAASASNQNAECDLEAQVTLAIEPTVKADLCLWPGSGGKLEEFLPRSIVNAKVTSGVVAIAKLDADLLGNQPVCADVHMYVPLRWAINEDKCILTAISSKLKKSATVWDSESSPIQKRFHWEDAVLVDACTRTEEIKTDPVDEEGAPYDEYKIFDFEEIVFGTIETSVTKVSMVMGESRTIRVESVPEGYDLNNLIYKSDNPAVCTVSNGTITGVGVGGTLVRISTPDKKFSTSVAVVVEEEYNDTSSFKPL